MTDKELRKLSRRELVDILCELQRRNDALSEQNTQLRQELEDKALRLSTAGSIAEAALRVNGVFEAAQAAAEQYLASVQQLGGEAPPVTPAPEDAAEAEPPAAESDADAAESTATEEPAQTVETSQVEEPAPPPAEPLMPQEQAEKLIADASLKAETLVAIAEEKAQGILTGAEEQARTIVTEAEARAQTITAEAETQAQESWAVFERRADEMIRAHLELRALMGSVQRPQ